jgi:hypothetical protein
MTCVYHGLLPCDRARESLWVRIPSSTSSKRWFLGTGCDLLLLTVKFPDFSSRGGNVHTGKEGAPGFNILFLGRKKEVPQLHGFFWSQMLKQYLKRILNKRLVGKLGVGVVLSDGFHSVVEIEAG